MTMVSCVVLVGAQMLCGKIMSPAHWVLGAGFGDRDGCRRGALLVEERVGGGLRRRMSACGGSARSSRGAHSGDLRRGNAKRDAD